MRRTYHHSGLSIVIHCLHTMAAFDFHIPKTLTIYDTEILHYGSTFFAWLSRQKLESLSVETLIQGLEANGFQNANVSSVS